MPKLAAFDIIKRWCSSNCQNNSTWKYFNYRSIGEHLSVMLRRSITTNFEVSIMTEESREQNDQKLDSLIAAIQSGFGGFERQLNDLRSDNIQLASQQERLASQQERVLSQQEQIASQQNRLSSQLTKIEERVQIIDSRINTIDIRLAGMSSDITGLQTEQNRIKEYLFNRPQ